MPADRYSRISEQVLLAHENVGTTDLAAGPAAADDDAYGAPTVPTWGPEKASQFEYAIRIKVNTGGPVTVNGASLIGQAEQQWGDIGQLNGGAAIVVSAAVAWERVLGPIGSFERLGVIAPSIAGGTVDIEFIPLERDV